MNVSQRGLVPGVKLILMNVLLEQVIVIRCQTEAAIIRLVDFNAHVLWDMKRTIMATVSRVSFIDYICNTEYSN